MNDLTAQKNRSWRMFNSIAASYDFVNRVLSLNSDLRWRKIMAGMLELRDSSLVLDCATGTGDVLLALAAQHRHRIRYLGLDMAGEMLTVARQKLAAAGPLGDTTLLRADTTRIPCRSDNFDAVTIAFGIRNVANPAAALDEMLRVLRAGGKALILEFSLPRGRFLRACSIFYLRRIIPMAGGLLSGNRSAYTYLNSTIESFPSGKAFCMAMGEAGFRNVTMRPLFCGIATVYAGQK